MIKLINDSKQSLKANLLTMLALVLVAILFFLSLFGTSFLNPQNISWLLTKDPALQFLGFSFFNQEPWHWPLGKIENYSYPWGTSIVYVDILMWLGVPAKIVFPGKIFQFFGIWILSCFILQALVGYWVSFKVSSSRFQAFFGGLLFLICPVFLFRMFENTRHFTLLAQFGVVLALFWVWEDIRHKKVSRKKWFTALLLAFALHFYFTLMIAVSWLAAEIGQDDFSWKAFFENLKKPKVILTFSSLAASIGALMFMLGYFVVKPKASIAEGGFGSFSMNLLAPLNSEGFSSFLPGFPTRSYEQREGMGYLGVGVLLLLGLIAFVKEWRTKVKEDFMKVKPILWFLLLFIFTLALSSRLTLGSLTLANGVSLSIYFVIYFLCLRKTYGKRGLFISAALILVYLNLGKTYRSSGRLSFVFVYLLLIYLMSFKLRRFLLPLVLIVQFCDLFPLMKAILAENQASYQEGQLVLEGASAWDSILKKVKQIKIISPLEMKREPLIYYALLHHLPIGPLYTARKDRVSEALFEMENKARLEKQELEPGVLYVIGDLEWVRQHPELNFKVLQGYTYLMKDDAL